MHGLTCDHLLQLINYAQFTQTVALGIKHSPVPISAVGNVTVLTGLDYQSTNSFDDPRNVSFRPRLCVPAIPSDRLMSIYVHASCPCWNCVQDLQHGEVHRTSTQAHDVALLHSHL